MPLFRQPMLWGSLPVLPAPYTVPVASYAMAQWRSVVPAPVHFFLARPVVPPLLPKTEKAAKFEVPMPPSLGAYPESAGIDGSAFIANFDRQKGRFGFPSLKLQSPAEAIQKARRRGEKNGYKWGLREAYHNVEINPWPDYESGSISSQSSMSKAETMAGLDAPQGTTTHSSGSRERVRADRRSTSISR